MSIFAQLIEKKGLWWEPETLVESAWVEHAPFAMWLVEVLRPKLFVELGTHNGMSYFSFCQAVERLQLETRCYAIDHWKGDSQAGIFSEEVYDEFVINNQKYAKFSTIIRKNFHEGLNNFEDDTVDIIHIDGYHSYEASREDFLISYRKLSKHGIILIHDINEYQLTFGINQFWNEIKENFPTFEFKHGHGLGIVSPKEVDIRLKSLFSSDQNETKFTRNLFEKLGRQVFVRYLYGILEEENKSLKQNLEIISQNNNKLSIEVIELKDTLKILYESKSWKLVSLLRKIKNTFFKR